MMIIAIIMMSTRARHMVIVDEIIIMRTKRSVIADIGETGLQTITII